MDVIVLSVDEFKQIVRHEVREALPKEFNRIHGKFNVVQAAQYLNMPVPTFRGHQHKIGGVKMGKRWMFTTEELDNYIEKHRRKTVDEIKKTV